MAKSRKPSEIVLRCADPQSLRDRVRLRIGESGDGGLYILADARAGLVPSEARRLAAWLVRAAEWIEGRDGKK